MERRDLPLTALRSFEAVGRLLSFGLAAKSLGVTHGAVSRQVSALEERLCARLLERGHRLALTKTGEELLADISPAFEQLSRAVESAARDAGPQQVVVVDAPPTFTMKWLIPRLSVFYRQFSGTDVRLVTGIGPISEIKLDTVDVVIRRLPSRGERGQYQPFLTSELVAVCAPELIEHKAPQSLADIEQLSLIEATTAAVPWREWLEQAGHRLNSETKFTRFEQMFVAYEAALEGLGVALLPSALVLDDIAARRLVIAWDQQGVYDRDYSFVKSHFTRGGNAVDQFCEWLLVQGQESDMLRHSVVSTLRTPQDAD